MCIKKPPKEGAGSFLAESFVLVAVGTKTTLILILFFKRVKYPLCKAFYQVRDNDPGFSKVRKSNSLCYFLPPWYVHFFHVTPPCFLVYMKKTPAQESSSYPHPDKKPVRGITITLQK